MVKVVFEKNQIITSLLNMRQRGLKIKIQIERLFNNKLQQLNSRGVAKFLLKFYI